MTSSFEWVNGLPAGAVWIAALSLLGLLVRQWVPLRKLQDDSEARKRGETRDDLHDCREELRAVNLRLDGFQEAFNNLKIELHGALAAYRILDAEVERNNPDSLGLRQARAILSSAFTVAPSTEAERPGKSRRRPQPFRRLESGDIASEGESE